jgi:Flp pilus assembly protein TadG
MSRNSTTLRHGHRRQARPRVGPVGGQGRDRGTMALELALLAPVFFLLLLLVVGFGRVTHGRQLVEQAAASAARSAALSGSPGTAVTAGRDAAARTLEQAGLSCRGVSVDVDTSTFGAGGEVTATVTCTSDLSSLALAGLPGTTTLQATARSPLEPFRDFGN